MRSVEILCGVQRKMEYQAARARQVRAVGIKPISFIVLRILRDETFERLFKMLAVKDVSTNIMCPI